MTNSFRAITFATCISCFRDLLMCKKANVNGNIKYQPVHDVRYEYYVTQSSQLYFLCMRTIR